MARASKKGQKIWVLIFYIIILLGLLAGFLIPMNFEAEDVAGTMLLMQIPDALSKFLATFGISAAFLSGAGSSLAISAPMSLIINGAESTIEITLDINAWAVVIYAVITVLSVICIIPAIVGCVTKKDPAVKKKEKAAKKAEKAAKKAAKKGEVLEDTASQEAVDPMEEDLPVKKKKKETTFHTAFTLEVLAAIVLFVINLFVIVDMQFVGGDACYPVAIAFAVVVIVGFVQRMIASGGSGFIKFLLFILSLAALFVAFFDIRTLIPSLADSINNAFPVTGSINAGFFGGAGADGLEYLCNYVFFTKGGADTLFPEYLEAAGWAVTIGAMILGILLLVNCFLDLLGIYKKTNKFMLVVNQIRYILEILALILCAIMVALDTDLNFGLMLIICAGLAIVSWVINLVRILRYRTAREAELSEPDETEEFAYFAPARVESVQTVYSSSFMEPAYAAPYNSAAFEIPRPPVNVTFYPSLVSIKPGLENPAAPAAPASSVTIPVQAAPKAAAAEKVQPVYNGPADKFISKLTDAEKVEFVKVFMERSERPLPSIRPYRIGSDNNGFFGDVVMHYTSVRDLISDGLLDKICIEDLSQK